MADNSTNILPQHIVVPLRALGGARLRFRALAVEFLPFYTDDAKRAELKQFFEDAFSEIDCALGVGLAEITKSLTAEDRIELVTELYDLNQQAEGRFTPGPEAEDVVH